ncbi:MAG: sigma-54-dependent Fis family transcriptional regulator [Deltaproteobacteria bacterium]|nr:sigma-54-dependent Fis family transcriptional regulator [Deltaproteobacteria bacterium]
MLRLLPEAESVSARWARAEAFGLRRDADAFPVGPAGALDERRARVEHVFREKHSMLAAAAAELSARSLTAIIADADGVILSAHDGGAFTESATRARLVPGADWSEAARGTNAIGTAIVERAAVAVIGEAHWEHRNAELFCYAAPVFDARGALITVLDVSGPLDRRDDAVGIAVKLAAAAMESTLRALAWARIGRGQLAMIERLVARARTPSLLIEARGAIGLCNDLARRDVLGERGELGCRDLFGIDFDELAELAIAGRPLRFETRRQAFRVELDPVLEPDGGALAVVVHLEQTESPRPALARRAVPSSFDPIFAEDEAVLAAKESAAKFAPTKLPVLLLAETGTGKELFARAIHGASAVASGPFVAINCGAVSEALLESQLFGYAPGAFTGASREGGSGLLGAADGGTLFLDEVAEMPPALQAALLRALEDGTYHRVGDPKPRRSSFRLITATCRDLPAQVEAGTFRNDLFYRIHGACIRIPPLRRRTDRVALASALLSRARPDAPTLAPSARAHIEAHEWPGNVRELKSALAHALILAEDEPIERRHFPELFEPKVRSRATVLREAAFEALTASGGNVSEAARRLGVARDTVYRMVRKGR